MSNQRSFKIESFRFAAFVPIENLGTKAFVLVRFQIFLRQLKVLFCL
jgi:hypothetical protein